MPAGLSASDFYYILPELVLTGGALLVLVADVLLPKRSHVALAWVTLAVIAATFAALIPFIHEPVREVATSLPLPDKLDRDYHFVVYRRRY